MLEYRVWIRRYPELGGRRIEQHVVVLRGGSPPGKTNSSLAADWVSIVEDNLIYRFQVWLLRPTCRRQPAPP
jgi:hypothetical protein